MATHFVRERNMLAMVFYRGSGAVVPLLLEGPGSRFCGGERRAFGLPLGRRGMQLLDESGPVGSRINSAPNRSDRSAAVAVFDLLVVERR